MRRILLVGGEREPSQSIKVVLRSCCANDVCDEAPTLSAARSRIETQKQKYDVLLLDLTLPDSIGMDTLRQLRQMAPHVPIVVLTESENEEWEDAVIASGADDCIAGTVCSGKSLLRSIGYAIDRRREHSEPRYESRLRAILDNLPAAVCYIDSEQRFRFVNREAESRMQRPQSEILGKTTAEIRGAQRHKRLCMDDAAALAGLPVKFTCGSTFPDGRERSFDVSLIPDIAEDGTVCGYFSLSTDVTEREEAIKQLNAGETQLRLIADDIPIAIVYIDKAKRYSFANREALAHLRKTRAEVIGKSIYEVLGPAWMSAHGEPMLSALAGAASVKMMASTLPDQESRIVSRQYIPHFSSDGAVLGTYVLIADITEREMASEALRSSEARYRSIIDNMAELYYETDADGRLMFVSPRILDLLGYAPIEMIGRSIADTYAEPLGRAKFLEEIAENNGVVRDYVTQLRRKDGSLVWVSINARCLFDDNRRIASVAGTIRDITERMKDERAMRRREAFLRSITDNLPISISYVDADKTFRFVNRTLEIWHGRPSSEIVGRRYDEYQQPGIINHSAIAEVMSGRRSHTEEYLAYGDGMSRWVDLIRVPDFDEDGKVRGYFRLAIDISERKAVELRLRRNELLLRAVADNLPAMISYIDGDMKIRFMNQPLQRRINRPFSEIIQRPIYDVIGTQNFESVRPYIESALAGESKRSQQRRIQSDGSVRWYDTVHLPDYDAGGHVRGCLMMAIDITENRRAESKLRDSEAQLRLVADNFPASISYVDREGRYRFVNKTNAEWMARPAEEIIGKTMTEIIGIKAVESFENLIGRVLDGDNQRRIERTVTYPDGQTRIVDVYLTPDISEDGEKRGCYFFVMDITERKATIEALRRSEEQLWQAQKMEALGQLTGGVAHDFNNLLAVIIGSLELIEQKLEDHPAEHVLAKRAGAAADRGAQLIARLLAFSRQQVLRPTVIEVDEVIVHLVEILHATLGAEFQIAMDIASPLWQCSLDPAQLETTLLNLAVNARDAMPGGGKLTFAATNVVLDEAGASGLGLSQPGEYVRLSVSDTGAGMSPDIARRVFEPFFTTKDVGKGTGLGLSMVYGFVQQSGGGVHVESALGTGTTIELCFPRAHVAERSHLIEEQTPIPKRPAGGGQVVLLVEDDLLVRQTMTAFLKKLNYVPIEAEDGNVALGKLAEVRDVAIMLSDIGLPGSMSGLDLAREASRRDPGLKVLLMSGLAQIYNETPNQLPLGVAVMRKPFTITDLAHRLRDLAHG